MCLARYFHHLSSCFFMMAVPHDHLSSFHHLPFAVCFMNTSLRKTMAKKIWRTCFISRMEENNQYATAFLETSASHEKTDQKSDT